MKLKYSVSVCLITALCACQPVFASRQQATQDPDRPHSFSSGATEEENAHWKAVDELVHKADDLLLAGKIPESVSAYHDVLALEPECHAAFEGIGDADLRSGEFEAAVAAYHAASKIEPSATNRFRLAVAYGRLGDYETAVREYQIGLSQFRSYPSRIDQILNLPVTAYASDMPTIEAVLLAYRASEFAGIGDDKHAIPLYRKAIRLRPHVAQMYLLLGHSLRQTRDIEGARANFEQAAAIGNRKTVEEANTMLQMLPAKILSRK